MSSLRGRLIVIRQTPFTGFVAGLLTFVVSIAIGGGIGATPASAVVLEFGAKGTGAGEFVEPSAIAVAQATGDVYVVDHNNSRVDSFGPEGAFRFAVGWGVADGKEEFEVCTTACRAGILGSGAGQFELPNAVATDASGDFYVVDRENFRVQKFDSEGHFLLTFGKGVNHSTNGNVCTAAEASNCGEGEFDFVERPGGGIAVDAAGTVYVGDFGLVQTFTPEGEFVSQFVVGEGSRVASIAVNKAAEAYVIAVGVPGVHRYEAFGGEVGAPFDTEHEPQSLALGVNGEVFVNEQEVPEGQPNLIEYEPTGTERKAFDIGTEGGKDIAFGDTIERVYVLNQERVRLVPVPLTGPPFVAPGSEALVGAKPTHAEVEASIDAEGSSTQYFFEYGTTTAYGSATPSAPLSEEGGLFDAVTASGDLIALEPNTEYHFRVVAENEKGEVSTGPDATFRTTQPVLIEGESVTEVTPESARLNVEINPEGAGTNFHYEYGLDTTYGEEVPKPDAEAGEAETSEPHSIVIENLKAGTTYHYRVVAHNEFGTVDGPDHLFVTTTFGVPTLADGRVWEMVSPPTKNSAALEAQSEEGGLIEASEDGDALTYVSKGPLGPEAESEGDQSTSDTQLIATRHGLDDWETQDITTPHSRPAGFHAGRRAEYLFFSNDLSKAFVEPFGETPLSEEATERTPYLREPGGYTPLVTSREVPPNTNFGGEEVRGGDYVNATEFVGAAEDGSSAALSSPVHLTEDLSAQEGVGPDSIYSWSAATHTLQLVSWLPATAEAPQETPAALAGDKAKLGVNNNVVRHAVSRGGSRFVYETEGPSGEKHLFVRDMRLGESVQVDLHEDGTSGHGLAQFQDASVDDGIIYFTDEERLTADATGEHNANPQTADLYRCEVEEVAGGLRCNLQNVTVPLGREAAAVLGYVVGTDEDGGRTYFVANGRLTPDAVHGTCQTVEASGSNFPSAATSCNLYVFDAATDEVRLVAVLSGRDFPDWANGERENLMNLAARVSPNGEYLAFMSQRSLTGYDNRDARSGVPDEEVFEYDFETSQLSCVSCKQNGARPTGVLDTGNFPGLLVDRPRIWSGQWLSASVPGWTSVTKAGPPVRADYQSRYLSNDGRLFFNSSDDLVPGDVNGQFDVYEYEPRSIGSCGSEVGCVTLMSSGRDSGESAFLDASDEGANVFFLTAGRLSPQDADDANDVYDARICAPGESCSIHTTPPLVACEELDSCRAASSPQPVPITVSTVGEGNIVATSSTATAPAKKVITRAQHLAKALKACRKKVGKPRKVCEASARKHYGPKRTDANKHTNTSKHRRGE
jgi:DNA-binding beta-propeller fold protein YncE